LHISCKYIRDALAGPVWAGERPGRLPGGPICPVSRGRPKLAGHEGPLPVYV
jgi:hypothetical protein